MSPEKLELEFLKNYVFTPELSTGFLTLLGKSKDFEHVLTKLFLSFTPEEWLQHKNNIFDFITHHAAGSTVYDTHNRYAQNNQNKLALSEANMVAVFKLPINYEVWGPSFNQDKWNTYLRTYKNNTFYNRLEPYFLEYAKKQESSHMALQYFKVKYGAKSSQAKEMISAFAECGIDKIPENQWLEVLQTCFHWSLGEKVKLIEHFQIEPTYSSDTFVFFLTYKSNAANEKLINVFANPGMRSHQKVYEKIDLSNLNQSGVAWFTNKLSTMSFEDIDTFFENKFDLKEQRKYFKSKKEFEEIAKKDYRHNSAQIQDYLYLLAFSTLILNPTNTGVATQLAQVLDPYLSHKMLDKSQPWWKKMQDLIEKEKFRQFLTVKTKSEWAPIYEKIALDKLVGPGQVRATNESDISPKKKYKI